MTERAKQIYDAWEEEYCLQKDFCEHRALSAAIRIIADELSYTIFMPNNDVRVVDTRVLYELANELEGHSLNWHKDFPNPHQMPYNSLISKGTPNA